MKLKEMKSEDEEVGLSVPRLHLEEEAIAKLEISPEDMGIDDEVALAGTAEVKSISVHEIEGKPERSCCLEITGLKVVPKEKEGLKAVLDRIS